MAKKSQTFCPLCGAMIVLGKLVLADGKEVLAYDRAYAHLVDHLSQIERTYALKESDWTLPLSTEAV